ncbi:MAG: GNAT family N-acetyltransferase [Candidatus Aminicenantes bacterium]|nr:GNAT family N-acetyltransferase [Candidatus Aminicenantes bacterium]
MIVRSARPEDRPSIRALAARLGLDYEDMEGDRFWIAEDGGRLAGLVGLKRHVDCLELVGLGVDPELRSGGIGGRLVAALAAAAESDVYLATIIPPYFARLGFGKAESIPAGMAKAPSWCEGCSGIGCTIMVRRRS